MYAKGLIHKVTRFSHLWNGNNCQEGQNGQDEVGQDPSAVIYHRGPAEALTSDTGLGSIFFRAGTLSLPLMPLWDNKV